jgi:pimeloyl-ACP methyl ester carboxylesterase
MPTLIANSLQLAYDMTGAGEPLVLVHGGWSDRFNWSPVVDDLARDFTVVTYDRRGHGRSERPADQGTRRDQEDDLAALVTRLGRGPVHLAGTSFGGSISLGLATRRPELVRSVVAHEPPLLSVMAGDAAFGRVLGETAEKITAIAVRVAGGDAAGAAEQFVEEVALGPGSWAMLPEPLRATMIDSAASFVAEQRDAAWATIDEASLAAIARPVLLTDGDASPAWFRPIVARLAAIAGDAADVHTYAGGGHAPHVTHPEQYVAAVRAFLAGSGDQAAAA